MILCDSHAAAERYAAQGVWGRSTLDGLAARCAATRPDDIALVDIRSAGAGSLSWRTLDLRVSALSGTLLDRGMRQDEAVGIQLPIGVEAIVCILACLRAGLIPALLPVLWRERDLAAACRRIAPAALVASSRCAGVELARMMYATAAASRSVRHVLAFGDPVPDGAESLDWLAGHEAPVEGAHGVPRPGNPADHVAVVTFRHDRTGPTPLARSHNQLLSAAAAVALRARIAPGATIATAVALSGLAGFTAMAAWLLSGGRLVIMDAATVDISVETGVREGTTHLLLPGVAGLPDYWPDALRIVRLWNDALQAEPCRHFCETSVGSLGEIALDVRGYGDPDALALGAADGDPASGLLALRLQGQFQRADTSVAAGSLLSGALRAGGPQAPGGRFPVRTGGDVEPGPGPGADGMWPTGLRARLLTTRPATARLTGHLRETVMCGAVPVALEDADRLYAGYAGFADAAAVAVPDPLLGHRLAAVAVPHAGGCGGLEPLHHYLRESGAAAWMLPARIVTVDTIPRSADGAVLRAAAYHAAAA